MRKLINIQTLLLSVILMLTSSCPSYAVKIKVTSARKSRPTASHRLVGGLSPAVQRRLKATLERKIAQNQRSTPTQEAVRKTVKQTRKWTVNSGVRQQRALNKAVRSPNPLKKDEMKETEPTETSLAEALGVTDDPASFAKHYATVTTRFSLLEDVMFFSQLKELFGDGWMGTKLTQFVRNEIRWDTKRVERRERRLAYVDKMFDGRLGKIMPQSMQWWVKFGLHSSIEKAKYFKAAHETILEKIQNESHLTGVNP